MRFKPCRSRALRDLMEHEIVYRIGGVYYVNESACRHMGFNKVITVRYNTVMMEA